MSSEENFTDDELEDVREVVVNGSAAALQLDQDASKEKLISEDESDIKNKLRKDTTRAGSSSFPSSSSQDKERGVVSTSHPSLVAATSTTLSRPLSALDETAGPSYPYSNLQESKQLGTATGNEAYLRFLAERPDDEFSSEDFTDDEQASSEGWEGFEDVNDNTKVKRDLQKLRAYMSQTEYEDSSCDEAPSAEYKSIIKEIPDLPPPPVASTSRANTSVSTNALVNVLLKLNNASLQSLEITVQELEKKLKKNRERFKAVSDQITEAMNVKVSDSWLTSLSYESPYFQDERGFTAPDNADYLLKKARREVVTTNFWERFWSAEDSEKVCEEIRKWEIEGIYTLREQERNSMRRMIAQCEDDEEKASLLADMNTVDDTDLDHLSLKQVIGTRSGQPDWMAMSVQTLKGEIAPETICATWENYLDPRLPKGDWDTDEDDRLKEIARSHGEQGWQAIATELNTGRTGFMCFMRYKAAIDHDFVGTRFTEREDNNVTRSVTATMYNRKVSWGQTEYLYRGRRNRKALQKRWRRLENDANEDLRKGRFTDEEDTAIMRAIEVHGTADFGVVARVATGGARSANQVGLRYQTLTREVVRGNWTLEEDVQLMRLVGAHGRDWQSVRHGFGPHRTRQQLRFRHEAVNKYVLDRMAEMEMTYGQVLDEMETFTGVPGARNHYQSYRERRAFAKKMLDSRSHEELRLLRLRAKRLRRIRFKRDKSYTELDDQFLDFFAVRYPEPPETVLTQEREPLETELADALSLILSALASDTALPDEEFQDALGNDLQDPDLCLAIAVLQRRQKGSEESGQGFDDGEITVDALDYHDKDSECGARTAKSAPKGLRYHFVGHRRKSVLKKGRSAKLARGKRSEEVSGGMEPVVSTAVAQSSRPSAETVISEVRTVAGRTAPNAETAEESTKIDAPKDRSENPPSDDRPAANPAGSNAEGLNFVCVKDQAAEPVPGRGRKRARRYPEFDPLGPIDLELPRAGCHPAVNCIALSSLLPLTANIEALQKKSVAALPSRTGDKIEIISQGKKVLLTKVTSLPPGVKARLKNAATSAAGTGNPQRAAAVLPQARAASVAKPTPVTPPPTLKLVSLQKTADRAHVGGEKIEIVNNGKTLTFAKVCVNPTSLSLPIPAQRKRKRAPSINVDPWTGERQFPPSMFSTTNRYKNRDLPLQIPRDGLPNFLLPPGLVTMIGLRTLLASINAMPTQKEEPRNLKMTEFVSRKQREAECLWESRLSMMFLLPAMLARKALRVGLRHELISPTKTAAAEAESPLTEPESPVAAAESPVAAAESSVAAAADAESSAGGQPAAKTYKRRLQWTIAESSASPFDDAGSKAKKRSAIEMQTGSSVAAALDAESLVAEGKALKPYVKRRPWTEPRPPVVRPEGLRSYGKKRP